MEFHSSSYRSGLIGLAIVCSLFLITGTLIWQIARLPFSLVTFGLSIGVLACLVALGIAIYWTIATLGLRYRLDRNGIRIQWGSSRWVIPIRNIEAIIPIKELGDDWGLKQAYQHRAWLGGWAGYRTLNDNRTAVWRSNEPLEHSLAVLTVTHVYVVSPEQPEVFIRSWRERRFLGTTQDWREEERHAHWLASPLWSDRVAWGLMGGILVTSLALFGTMAIAYPQLPEKLALHFDVFGQPDRIGQRSEVLHLPIVALLMLTADLGLGFALYRHDRVAAYLIWTGGILSQTLAWGALYTIIAP